MKKLSKKKSVTQLNIHEIFLKEGISITNLPCGNEVVEDTVVDCVDGIKDASEDPGLEVHYPAEQSNRNPDDKHG